MLVIQQSLEPRVALSCTLKASVTADLKRVCICLKLRSGTSLTLRGSLAAAFVKPAFGSWRDLHFTCTVIVTFCPCIVDTGTTCDKLLQTTLLCVVYFCLKKFHFLELGNYREQLPSCLQVQENTFQPCVRVSKWSCLIGTGMWNSLSDVLQVTVHELCVCARAHACVHVWARQVCWQKERAWFWGWNINNPSCLMWGVAMHTS